MRHVRPARAVSMSLWFLWRLHVHVHLRFRIRVLLNFLHDALFTCTKKSQNSFELIENFFPIHIRPRVIMEPMRSSITYILRHVKPRNGAQHAKLAHAETVHDVAKETRSWTAVRLSREAFVQLEDPDVP